MGLYFEAVDTYSIVLALNGIIVRRATLPSMASWNQVRQGANTQDVVRIHPMLGQTGALLTNELPSNSTQQKQTHL